MDDRSGTDDNELVSRLRVIEDQPLDARAEAYASLAEELRRQLEGSDAPARG